MSKIGWKERFTISLGGFIFALGLALIMVALLFTFDFIKVDSFIENLDLIIFFALTMGVLDTISGFILAIKRHS